MKTIESAPSGSRSRSCYWFCTRFYRPVALAMVVAATTHCQAPTMGGKRASDMYNDPKVVSLVEAAMSGDTEKVAALAREGVRVNIVAPDGPTPLMWALHANNEKGIRALLDAGADPNLKMKPLNGFSAMELAAGAHDQNSAAILRDLLAHGGNPNLPVSDPPHDHSLLAIAAAEGQLTNVRELLNAGADLNAHSAEIGQGAGQSAMDSAIAMGQYEIALYMLNRGYNYRLDQVAGLTQSSLVGPTHEPARDGVIKWLQGHGVKYPAHSEKEGPESYGVTEQ